MKQSIIIILSILAMNSVAYAQKDLESDEVDVVKVFDAKLLETEKLKIQPLLPAPDTTGKAQDYDINNRSVTVEYLAPKIRPIAMKTQALPPSYKGYAKAGFGIPQTIFVEGGYHLVKKDQYNIGAYLQHHSMNRKSVPLQRYANSLGKIDGTFYTKNNLAVGANVGFGQENYHYYGYDSTLIANPTDAQARQRYNMLDIGVNVFNPKTTDIGLDYKGGLDFYRLSDIFASKETGVVFTGTATKWFSEKHPLAMTIKGDFTTLDTNGVNQKLNNIYFQPSFTYHADRFSLKAGLNLVTNNDEFYFLPDLEANANIIGATLSFFAGYKGDFYKNTLRTTALYNPFINSNMPLSNTEYTKIYGGIKGTIKIFEYSIQGGYGLHKNMGLYLANSGDQFRRFNITYDTVKVINVGGTFIIRPIKGLDITASINQNIFTPTLQSKAFGIPAFELNTGIIYKLLADKLRIKANLFMQNGISYLDEANAEKRGNALFDLNIGAEYWFMKNVGAFIDFNNLANNQYQRWYRYPTIGTNILGGVVARF